MKNNDAVRTIMKLRGYSFQALADKLGKRNASAIANPLNRTTSMRIDTLVDMANAMDCEVVIRSKLKDKSEWVID